MIHEKQIEEIRAMTPEQRLEVYRDLMHAADTWLASLEPEEARRRFKLMNAKRAWVTDARPGSLFDPAGEQDPGECQQLDDDRS